MKIVLIGFMGSGKSTVARHLANTLDIPALEMDDRIVELSDCNSIPQIFEEQGEEEFRRVEQLVAKEIALKQELIVSSGGGAVMNDANRDAFKAGDGLLIFLHTSFDEICSRLTDISTRPLFQNIDEARTLYAERESRYLESADITISTDSKTPEEIAREIVDLLAKRTS